MKQKIIRTILGMLVLSVLVLTIFFIIIINHQYNENIKKNLQENNRFLISVLNTNNIQDKETFFKTNLSNLDMRVTYIDENGEVIFDSAADRESMDNHNDRPEVKDAREKGTGNSIRYSHSVNKNMMYVATAFGNGYIIRSSMPVELINNFENRYIRYYLITLLSVVFAAAMISSRLSQVMVKPLRDLQAVTSGVANGELFKRVSVLSDDEIGDLGRAFNNMADKLQHSIKEVIDKQNRLEAILKSMDSGVIAIDKKQRIIMINPYAKEIFGIDKDIIGCNLVDIIKDFELENIFKQTNKEYNEMKMLWPKERELRIKTADIINEDELIGTVAVVQDITDIKRLENVRSQFVANVSHELKTPLTSIKGFAETLKYVDDQSKRDKFLDIINDEAERLTRLINDILTLSHIEMHREDKVEKVNLNAVIEDVFNLMKSIADSKNVKLTVVGRRIPQLLGDRDRFKQMILNLVDNAIKYSGEGASVVMGTDFNDNTCTIWVEDTGAGMSKEHLSRIFERFYRVDRARSRALGGTGLGLAIVKHIVLSYNGSINVESELGKGTKFIITIPMRRVE